MDTPSAPDTSPLDTNQAAAAFAALLEPQTEEEKQKESDDQPQAEPVEGEAQDAQTEEGSDDATVTIEVDGKEVTLTKAELAEAYKSGLRQSDYTKKTMEVSEQRKAAEAEVVKARQEREAYASNLQRMGAALEHALIEQQQTNWQALLESDPQAYLKERHLFETRQAAYQQNMQEQAKVKELSQAEAQQNHLRFLEQQRDELFAKLPDWKDEGKRKADQEAISKYLMDRGMDRQMIDRISDHRFVLIARDAMRYQEMVGKAAVAVKKVQQAPAKVFKPGVGDSPRVDGRTTAMRNLSKSGSVADAAEVFKSFL